jgi:hypothetical protein
MEHCLFPVAASNGIPDYTDWHSWHDTVVTLHVGNTRAFWVTTANGVHNFAYTNLVKMTLHIIFVAIMWKSSNWTLFFILTSPAIITNCCFISSVTQRIVGTTLAHALHRPHVYPFWSLVPLFIYESPLDIQPVRSPQRCPAGPAVDSRPSHLLPWTRLLIYSLTVTERIRTQHSKKATSDFFQIPTHYTLYHTQFYCVPFNRQRRRMNWKRTGRPWRLTDSGTVLAFGWRNLQNHEESQTGS